MGECLILKSGGGTDTSDGTATVHQILQGYTAYVNDSKLTGTMPNRGAVTTSLNAGGSYTIINGYHNGSGKVTSNSLSSQTSGTATNAQILWDWTAWVNGSLVTGRMPAIGTVTYALPANGTQWIPAGWHSGSGYVNQSIPVQVGWTCTPSTVDQVVCWSGWFTSDTIWCAGDGNLVPWNIRNGVWIFNVCGTWTGWVDQNIYIIQNGNIIDGMGFSYNVQNYRSGVTNVTDQYPYRQPGDGTLWMWGADHSSESTNYMLSRIWFNYPCNIPLGQFGMDTLNRYLDFYMVIDYAAAAEVWTWDGTYLPTTVSNAAEVYYYWDNFDHGFYQASSNSEYVPIRGGTATLRYWNSSTRGTITNVRGYYRTRVYQRGSHNCNAWLRIINMYTRVW